MNVGSAYESTLEADRRGRMSKDNHPRYKALVNKRRVRAGLSMKKAIHYKLDEIINIRGGGLGDY